MKRILVTFGGSHRQNEKTIRAFRDAGIELSDRGAAGLGSKRRHGIMPDTPEARELLKKYKGTVARRQWSFLNEGLAI